MPESKLVSHGVLSCGSCQLNQTFSSRDNSC